MTEPAAIAIGADWVTIGPGPAGAWDGSSGQAAGPAVPLRCWWARPLGQAPRAAVIVLPEVFGVNGWVRSVADRLAAAGYAALALNTMARTAPDLELDYDAAGLQLGRQHRDAVTAAGFLDDLAASVAWIRAQPDLAGGPIGCVGFCFGGHPAGDWRHLRLLWRPGFQLPPRRRPAQPGAGAPDPRAPVVLLR